MKRLFIAVLLTVVILLFASPPASASNQLRLHYFPEETVTSVSGTCYILEAENTGYGVALHEAEVYLNNTGNNQPRATIEILIRHRCGYNGRIKYLEIGYYAYLKDGEYEQVWNDVPATFNTEYEWRVTATKRVIWVETYKENEPLIIDYILLPVSKIYRISMSLEYAGEFVSNSRWSIKQTTSQHQLKPAVNTLYVWGGHASEPSYGGARIGYGINLLNGGQPYYYNALTCGGYSYD